MTNDTQGEREVQAREVQAREVEAIWADDSRYKTEEECYLAIADLIIESLSIPAAAALLRANGWTVQNPVCKTCDGEGWYWADEEGSEVIKCPTCNGTGAAKGDVG